MTIATHDVQLEQRPNGGRYFHRFADNSEAELIYVADGADTVIMTHTYTPTQHRGQGVAAVLVARAVSDFQRERRKVIPSCWFARQEFSAHPEWSDLLAKGKRA